MDKWTKGPWSVEDDKGHITIIGNGFPIAEMWISDGNHHHNAKLIAAAPEMAAALREILNAAEMEPRTNFQQAEATLRAVAKIARDTLEKP